MSTRTRGAVAVIAAAATLSAVGLAGCELLAQNTPLPTPDPTTASTPTESEKERTIRLDKEAAEQAYTAVITETIRLGKAGGVSKPTNVLTDNARGAYLKVQMDGLRDLKSKGNHAGGTLKTSVTADGGWSEKEIGLTACEDGSQLRLLDRSGKEVEKDRPKRFVQTLTATKADGRWKITDVDSRIVKTFRNEGGCSDL